VLKDIGRNEKACESEKIEAKRKNRAVNFGVADMKVESACEGMDDIVFIL